MKFILVISLACRYRLHGNVGGHRHCHHCLLLLPPREPWCLLILGLGPGSWSWLQVTGLVDCRRCREATREVRTWWSYSSSSLVFEFMRILFGWHATYYICMNKYWRRGAREREREREREAIGRAWSKFYVNSNLTSFTESLYISLWLQLIQ